MDALNVFMGIFAAVGVLAVTALLLYLIAKALKKYNPSSSTTYPDTEYMEKIGSRCPSGWIHKGTMKDDSGVEFDICRNDYNVPVCRDWHGDKIVNGETLAGCYSDEKEPIALFPVINNWKDYLKGNVSGDYRCQWINRCGPPSEVTGNQNGTCAGTPPASWIGLDDKC